MNSTDKSCYQGQMLHFKACIKLRALAALALRRSDRGACHSFNYKIPFTAPFIFAYFYLFHRIYI